MNAPYQQGSVAQKSFPVGKFIAGCGCLSAVAVAVALALTFSAGAFALFKVKEEVAEFKEAGLDLNGVLKGAKDSVKTAEKAKALNDDLTPEAVMAALKSPLTKKELEAHRSFLVQWEGRSDVKRVKNSIKGMHTAKGGATDSLKNMKLGLEFYKGSIDSMEDFEKVTNQYGGPQKVVERLIRVGALTGAARAVASHEKLKDPSSDAVAKAMIALHPKVKADYNRWRQMQVKVYRTMVESKGEMDVEKIQALMEKNRASNTALKDGKGLHQANQRMSTLALLHPKTLALWTSLSTATRNEYLEKYAVPPTLPMFAMGVDAKKKRDFMTLWILGFDMALIAKEAQSKP